MHPAPGTDPETLWQQIDTRLSDLLSRHDLAHVRLERATEPVKHSAGGKVRAVIPFRDTGLNPGHPPCP